MKRTILAGLFFGFLTTIALSASLSGEKTIFLVEADGTRHSVATVTFRSGEGHSAYKVNWHDDRFADHFLSMRPFKCLEGNRKYWCRVPYTYEIRRTVSTEDLGDLEYDTMFIWKGATEYGINMWNGVYYKLKADGGRLVGRLHELDMDKLSAPPDKGNLRPLKKNDLEPGEPESHWLPTLIIE